MGRTTKNAMNRLAGLVTVLGLAAAVLPAAAVEVRTSLSARETYVGVPITLRVTVEDGEPDLSPIVPVVEGLSARLVAGPARGSQTTIVNGRMTQRSSVSYDFQITPFQAGKFTIPAVEVQVAGQKLTTSPQVLLVSKSETGDLLFVEVAGARDTVYVGEPLDVTLQIWLRPYQSKEYKVTLSEGNMWDLIDPNACQWGVFLEAIQQLASRRQRPIGREVFRKDNEGLERSYYLYEVVRKIWPERPGKLDVGEVNIVFRYPTGIGRGQSLFDAGLVLTGVRPVSMQVKTAPVEIKPVPEEGRPAWYRGAVGQYDISATAKPLEVTVGDPITLTLSVTGTGRLDLLQPPPLPDLPELTRGFKVPTDPLAGEVQGNVKIFTQSIRATSDAVKEIPAIPFAFFNPAQGKYETVRSKPIPLQVKPADRLSSGLVVDANLQGAVARTLTEVSGGILANYTSVDDVLSHQDVRPGWGVAMLMCVPPAVFSVCWIVQRQRNRLLKDTAFARRHRARRTARSRLRDTNEESLPAAVFSAIGGYVADRRNLPPGSLTRAEIVGLLGERGVNAAVSREIDDLLATCEQMQYAGRGGRDVRELVPAAERCIDLLERERF